MKLKGISGIERHCEKLVFAVFALFLLFVLVLQVGLIGASRTVKVGSRDVPLDQAHAAVADIAKARQAKLESTSIAEGIPQSMPSVYEKYQELFRPEPAMSEPLAALGRPGIIRDDAALPIGGGAPLASKNAPFVEIRLPAPAAPITAVYEGTIDPIAVSTIGDGLAALLPDQQPFDSRSVSLQSSFDAAALRQALTTPTPDGSAQALPPTMWQGRIELVDVLWVRQELGADGTWGAETLLPPVPGRQSLREKIEKPGFVIGDWRELLDLERTARKDIRRPEFYPTISGQPWMWPSLVAERAKAESNSEVGLKSRELRNIRGEIELIKQQLNPKPAPDRRKPSRRPGDRDDDGGGGEPPQPDDEEKEREQQRRATLQQQLKALEERETKLLADLSAMGVDPSGKAIQPAESFKEILESLSRNDAGVVTLWMHDLTAKPGGVYRYKLRVVATNPLFGQGEKLLHDQRSRADAPVLTSEDSAWSAPITIEPSTVFFLTSATEAGGPLAGRARASAEIFQFFYGYWRRVSVNLLPGDAVSGEAELPELETFEIVREGTAFKVKDRSPLDRTKPLELDAVLLDVAPVVDGKQGSGFAYVREAGSRVAQHWPMPENDPVRSRLLESHTLGQQSKPSDPAGTVGSSRSGRREQPPEAPNEERDQDRQ